MNSTRHLITQDDNISYHESEASVVRLSAGHSARVVKDEPYGAADKLIEPVTWAAARKM